MVDYLALLGHSRLIDTWGGRDLVCCIHFDILGVSLALGIQWAEGVGRGGPTCMGRGTNVPPKVLKFILKYVNL
jgi:hypothetical protein